MAKRVNSFKSKGDLAMAEGKIFEVKKDEIIEVEFFKILKEFDGKTVSISISEETEIGGSEDTE
jgi:hypothetical protein